MELTPRPSIDVLHLSSSQRELKARRKGFKRILKKAFDLSSSEKHTIHKVISRYRRRQKRLLGEKDEDPDPYSSDYVFYCLDGPREK
jgi:hypothetical protein